MPRPASIVNFSMVLWLSIFIRITGGAWRLRALVNIALRVPGGAWRLMLVNLALGGIGVEAGGRNHDLVESQSVLRSGKY